LKEKFVPEKIQEGFDVFVHDGGKAFGAVRQVHDHDIVIYVENAGDFVVPLTAVKEVDSEKVVLDSGRLEPKLREAIRRAHAGEDPRIP
jgi:hypothetical protein